ncbi:endonuclease domain-containing protein [Mycolicibacterium fallax]|uniref:endonuclease domain-containing protein n=1 Tax=Mycolicibacterium fallax TaxID=1793 RepID=UPI000A150A51|nr:DUF559 domain-containing protein [Mycolicibacterium fallax]BBY98807.1 hypothetical protein MFAL_22740 [Mycolicibacterium fallax]
MDEIPERAAAELPFSRCQALLDARITPGALRGPNYQRLYRGVYLSAEVTPTAAIRARAAWLSTGATLVCVSAAAMHGTKWLNADWPAQISRRSHRNQPGLIAYSWLPLPQEVMTVDGLPVTTAARTAFDLGRLLPAERSVALLDALMNATGITPAEVLPLLDRHPRLRGRRRLRTALALCDPGAESPPETRLRLTLCTAGLPVPQTQIELPYQPGAPIRLDLGWPQWRVAVEYDGAQHWDDPRQRAWDIERAELIEAAGWTVIRVSAAMLERPNEIVKRVRDKLRAAGCPI